MGALLRDAYNRKLVSIRLLFTLALGYEGKIAELKRQHANDLAAARRSVRSGAAGRKRKSTETPAPRAQPEERVPDADVPGTAGAPAPDPGAPPAPGDQQPDAPAGARKRGRPQKNDSAASS